MINFRPAFSTLFGIGIIGTIALGQISESTSAAAAGCLKAVTSPPEGYNHDAFDVQPKDRMRHFSAYPVSFDGSDGSASLRISEWVAYEMRKSGSRASGGRPSPWCHDKALFDQSHASKDDSYKYSKQFRKNNKDWYVRGHLTMKCHAEPISNDATWNTHTSLNAVPQRQSCNAGSWLSLECLTGMYANKYGVVWIITGSVFDGGKPLTWIGEEDKSEKLIAVPDRVFKVVIRQDGGTKILAFISPNRTERGRNPYDHSGPITTIENIEHLTGLKFSKLASNLKIDRRNLWPVSRTAFLQGCRKQAQDIN